MNYDHLDYNCVSCDADMESYMAAIIKEALSEPTTVTEEKPVTVLGRRRIHMEC